MTASVSQGLAAARGAHGAAVGEQRGASGSQQATEPGSGAEVRLMMDVEANRAAPKYGRGELVLRALWMPGRLLFRLTPRPFFGVRRVLLRLFGARVGRQVHIYPSATIYLPWRLTIGDRAAIGEYAFVYNLGAVSIGARATISHKAHLCAGTHDYTDPSLPLVRSTIVIENDAWVCADAFVGAGVRIGRGAVVAARAVAVRNVDDWSVVAGNPARHVKFRRMKVEG